MTDNFEKAMASIAIKSAKNGGATIDDVLTALVAKNEDDDRRAEILRKEALEAKEIAAKLAAGAVKAGEKLAADNEADHRRIIDSLASHQTEANVRDVEIQELQAWRKQASERCEERVVAIVRPLCEELHGVVHQRHLDESHGGAERRKDDPPDSAFFEKRQSAFPEDEEYGDIKRFWRFGKWALAAGVLIFIDMFARYLSHTLFGYPS
jgi:hypothetical protein